MSGSMMSDHDKMAGKKKGAMTSGSMSGSMTAPKASGSMTGSANH
jgi:hypothetical protein